jgi:class 3 adenylate cyclase/predicted ATPase
MSFIEIVDRVITLLKQRERVSYRMLKREFALDDEAIADLKDELISAQRIAVDEEGKVLVWAGALLVSRSESQVPSSPQPPASQTLNTEHRTPNPSPQTLDSRQRDSRRDAAERRQLTVMFCDLVGSTALSAQLDPEELREVVRGYQETCTDVVRRYDGHIAQHLGDGLLVYFGYPAAHEDDAQRAVWAGLEIVGALRGQVTGNRAQTKREPLQVRIGIHTGLVVIGEIGSSEKREILALGETPNLAARVQGQAAPDEVVMSAATYHLVEGLFECEPRGQSALKGVATPLTLYRVMKESEAHSRFEVVVRKGLTPLIGRDHEFGLLQERWQRVKEDTGQVVLLGGEPGIGKSRLVEALKETVEREGARCLELRCSPYHQNSALYPIIDHLQRGLGLQSGESPEDKLRKLEHVLASGGEVTSPPQTETLALFASLLSLPHPASSPPITVSPQKQKEKTQAALVGWLVEEAKQKPVYTIWEDLHWADPSTLEVLTLMLDQVPTTRMLALLTFRPEFIPPWKSRSHISHLTLNRLGQPQVEAMVDRVTGDKTLPAEVIQQIVAKTDGVPLFVEELTKSVLESVGVHGGAPLLSLAIPSTLHDSLMARLDRLGPAKEVAQVGAVLGREFSYDLLHAVSPIDEEGLQHGLKQLVEAGLVYQRGVLPQAHYLFKHALIQDTAYQSLLKSRRQQLHNQVAQVLEEQFPQTIETQPELVARHYTEAGLIEQAIPYWQRAGERAIGRSALVEGVAHLTKGLELLKTLPDTPERAQQELTLLTTLGFPLKVIKGYGAPEVGQAYARARELCQQIGETPQLFTAIQGLCGFYIMRAEYRMARELAEQCLTLAQRVQDPVILLWAHATRANVLFYFGELTQTRAHGEQGLALYDPRQHRSVAFSTGHDLGVHCLSYALATLWLLGYPDQARKRNSENLGLAQELALPSVMAFALYWAVWLHHAHQEGEAAQEQAEVLIALAREHGFPWFLTAGTILRGWALVEQGQGEEGIAQIRQGLTAYRAQKAEQQRTLFLALLAEAYGKVRQAEEGLSVLAEALAMVDHTEECVYEAELYRLRGELKLVQENQKSKVKNQKSKIETNPQPLTPSTQAEVEQEAEGCFLKAIEIARKQQAKSLELRAVMSLVRLRQQQMKDSASRNTHDASRASLDEAHTMLSEVYHWFTEGFDTKDLQEAKALLEELSHYCVIESLKD